jgi:GDP-L-fucose synthase
MKKILITGANGLCGNALKRLGDNYQYCCHFIGREFGDLTILDNVQDMYNATQPDYVVHTAAEVGGIGGNEAHHGEFFYNNILMNAYMIDQARRYNVEKMIVFSSVCVFPDGQTLTEDNMHNGPVYSSNFAYGHAKRMVDIQIQAYQKQYGIKNYCSVIPGNIFATHDAYNTEYGHVIPSLIHKLYLAKNNNTDFVVWGDGSAKREFIYADDLARVIYGLLDMHKLPLRLIVSGPKQYTIKEIVHKLVRIANFSGKVVWDKTKPNGQHSRPSDLSLLYSLFPHFEFSGIDQSLETSYNWFVENYPNVRT